MLWVSRPSPQTHQQICGDGRLSTIDLSRLSYVRHGRSLDAVLNLAIMTRGNVRRSATRLLRALAQPNATAEQSPALLPVFDICNGRAASRATLTTLAGGSRGAVQLVCDYNACPPSVLEPPTLGLTRPDVERYPVPAGWRSSLAVTTTASFASSGVRHISVESLQPSDVFAPRHNSAPQVTAIHASV